MTKHTAKNLRGLDSTGLHLEKTNRPWRAIPFSLDYAGEVLAVRQAVPVEKIAGNESKSIEARRNRYEAITNAVTATVAKMLEKTGAYVVTGYADEMAGTRMMSHLVAVFPDYTLVAYLRGPANAKTADGARIDYAGVNAWKVYRVDPQGGRVALQGRVELTTGGATCQIANGELPSLCATIGADILRMGRAGWVKTVSGEQAERTLSAAIRVGMLS